MTNKSWKFERGLLPSDYEELSQLIELLSKLRAAEYSLVSTPADFLFAILVDIIHTVRERFSDEHKSNERPSPSLSFDYEDIVLSRDKYGEPVRVQFTGKEVNRKMYDYQSITISPDHPVHDWLDDSLWALIGEVYHIRKRYYEDTNPKYGKRITLREQSKSPLNSQDKEVYQEKARYWKRRAKSLLRLNKQLKRLWLSSPRYTRKHKHQI